MKTYNNKFFQFIKNFYFQLTPYILTYYSCLLILRIYDYYKFKFFSSESGIKAGYLIGGLLIDLILTNILVLFFGFIFSLSNNKSIKNGLLNVFLITTLFANLILIEVFQITHELLDELFFRFSFSELKVIVGNDGFNLTNILKFVLLAVFYFVLIFSFKKISFKNKFLSVCAIFSILSVVFIKFIFYENEKQIATKMVNNKLAFFTIKSVKYFFEKDKLYQKPTFINNKVIAGESLDSDYPFKHKFVLDSAFASLFNKNKKDLPEIVIIIVESLNTKFVGKYSNKYGNILPFLDSLSAKSLYFPHIISTSERTFNVLPAILGSVPFSPEKRIFMSLDIPKHYSLISLLSKSYFSRFYCGVYLDFHNMRNYLLHNEINYLVNSWEKQFNEKFSPENVWGFPDQQLFDKSFVDENTRHKNIIKNKLDVFLTISTHFPFEYPNKKDAIKKFKEELNSKKISKDIKKHIIKNIDGFSSFRYLDNSLRSYFKKIEKSKNFNNTIFIITGDHGSEINQGNSLDKVMVPLIIYSKLIKEPKTFNAISGHNDILPSLLSLLKLNYLYFLPEDVPFVGKKLNLNQSTFNKNIFYPSITNNYYHKILLENNYFLYKNEFYKVNDKLELTESKDNKQKNLLLKDLNDFSKLSSYCTQNDKIIDLNSSKKWINEYNYKLFKLSYKNNIDTKEEFIFIDNNQIYEKVKKCKMFKYEIEGEIYIEKKSNINLLPKFTSALTKNDSLYYWKQGEYVFPFGIKNKTWNKFKISLEYILTELIDLDYFKLSHYIYNKDKINVKMRNIKIITYKRE